MRSGRMRYAAAIALAVAAISACTTHEPATEASQAGSGAPLPERGARWAIAKTIVRAEPDSAARAVLTLEAGAKLLGAAEGSGGWIAVYHPTPAYDTMGFVLATQVSDQRPPIRVAGRLVHFGELFHITGCENGRTDRPIVSEVNLWFNPQVGMGRVVGQLSGDGRADQGLRCQGAIVRLQDSYDYKGRIALKVESIVNGQVGWLLDSFVGKAVSPERCRALVAGDAAALQRCGS